MFRKTLPIPALFCLLSLIFTTSSFAAKHDKEQMKKDFNAWHAKTNAAFEEGWAGIIAAEAAAKPAYEKGVKLAEAGKTKEAIKSLLDARAMLYGGANGHFIHVNKGLSFKIALALAEIYDELDDAPRLKRETSFMDVGRPWLSKEEEHKIFNWYAINEVKRVWNIEEGKSGKRMKTKERKRLHRILSYMVVGTSEVIFPDGHKMSGEWEDAADAAKKTYAKDEFSDFGGQGGVEDHYKEMAPVESNFPVGGVVLVINQEVTKVTKKRFEIDLTEARLMPVNCKSTGKVLEVTQRGRFIYKQKCEFFSVEGGHKLVIKNRDGLKLKKGDVITMYAPVEKLGKPNKEVTMGTPAVVHSSRKGKTQWLLGVKTKKPSFIKKDGDFRVLLLDDAEAPPKVK